MAIIRMRDHLYDEIVNYAKEDLRIYSEEYYF